MAIDRANHGYEEKRQERIRFFSDLFSELAAAPAGSNLENVVPRVLVFATAKEEMRKYNLTFADFGITEERFDAGHRAVNCFELREWLKARRSGLFHNGKGVETHMAKVISDWGLTAAELGITDAELLKLLGKNN